MHSRPLDSQRWHRGLSFPHFRFDFAHDSQAFTSGTISIAENEPEFVHVEERLCPACPVLADEVTCSRADLDEADFDDGQAGGPL